jgi:molybdopterin-guanine dinucleotide biosynthesis protein A
MNRKGISGFVLTGGKSSRMGTDKGMLLFDRKPLVLYALETLDEVAEQTMISANDSAYDQFSRPVVKDLFRDIGPMGGIYSCLRQSVTEFNIFLSCDTPFVPSALFVLLLQHIGDYACALPVHDGNRIEPLCAIYRKSCVETFAELIEKGCYKMHDAVNRIGYAAVEIDNRSKFYDRHVFFNINTLDDYKFAFRYIEDQKYKKL